MTQNQKRSGATRSGAIDTKVPAKSSGADLNKDRLIFVLTSLVGQRVTAKLRDNVIYEGLFHSFSYENDYAITLKSARKLASEMSKSGKVMEALIIPGKDFLQVSALDVPSPSSLEREQNALKGDGFKTDGDISQKANLSSERDLVAWSGPDDGSCGGLGDGEGASASNNGTSWDQFAVNEQRFGVSTTFNEELYTTKLDPNSIPREKREEADRLAREIENGNMAAEVEATIDGEDDEEARFSAVTGTGAYKARQGGWGNSNSDSAIVGTSGAAASAKARGGSGRNNAAPAVERTSSGPAALSPIPLSQMPEERHRQEDAVSDPRAGAAGARSPGTMKTSMVSEMKRINALNLEPAVPKLEDKSGSDWTNFQTQQSRNQSKSVGGNAMKLEFQQSLEVIQKREAAKLQQKNQQQLAQQQEAQQGASSDNWRQQQGGGKGGQLSLPPEAMQQGNMMQQRGGQMQMGGQQASSKFTFNPNAKDFTFNPGASSFTPSSAGNSGGPSSMTPTGQQQQMAPNQSGAQAAAAAAVSKAAAALASSPPFTMFSINNNLLNKNLDDILDGFCRTSQSEVMPNLDPSWPEALGPTYHDVLGQPNPANPLPPVGNMGAQPMGGPWQQQQQQQQQPMGGQAPPGAPVQGGGQALQGGQAPQLMPPQNFMMAQPGPGQMYQPMYQGPGGPQMAAQRPQNPGQMQQQDQQQPMGFQPGMSAPGQQGQGMAVPSGIQGGQNPGMMMQPMPGGAMPKFGMQMVMVPAGQAGPQGGFVPQGGFQPQQGQPGPQPGGPPGGQQGHWQQAHMMPAHMQQVGPRGPPQHMGGQDG